MSNRKAAVLGLLFIGAAALTACGPSKSEQTEVATCTKLAKAMLHAPEEFKVVETKIEETSEGNIIRIEVDYKGANGGGHVSDKCWFAGYGEDKPLARFSYREGAAAQYVELSDEDLKVLLDQIKG